MAGRDRARELRFHALVDGQTLVGRSGVGKGEILTPLRLAPGNEEPQTVADDAAAEGAFVDVVVHVEWFGGRNALHARRGASRNVVQAIRIGYPTGKRDRAGAVGVGRFLRPA